MAGRKVMASIGLVPLPLRIEKAIDDDDPDLHTVCIGDDENPHDPIRVKQSVNCPTCERSASSHYGFKHRARETMEGLILVSTDELQEAKGRPITGNVAKGEPVVTIEFSTREKVYAATVVNGSVNNLTPDKGGEKPYAALYRYLTARPGVVAVFEWAPRTNNTTWVVEPTADGRLVATAMAKPERVRAVPAVARVEVTENEEAMFFQLADSMVEDFDPVKHADAARVRVEELIASRSAVPAAAAPQLSASGDMLGALQESLAAAKPRAVKATAKKAPAKKRTTKKTAAKELPQTA
jgi:non-homologous end joining protein Ku